ncbi:hypothetical protein [Rugosimonospora acidiphila]
MAQQRPGRGEGGLYWDTVTEYEFLCNGHIIADLGGRRLREPSASDVDRWSADKPKIFSTSTYDGFTSA